MQHQFSDSGAKVLVILEDMLPKLTDIIANTQLQHVITTAITDFLAPSAAKDPRYISLSAAITAGMTLPQPTASAGLDDLAILQYTGGTTGVSKGAMLTHRSVLTNMLQVGERLGEHCQEAKETFICPLPLYHIYAFMVNMFLFFGKGNHSVLIANPRDIPAFVEAMKAHKMTGFAGLNTLFVGLSNYPPFTELDFSSLHLTLSGGTALTQQAADDWMRVTGCTITEGYGLSETSPVVSLNQPQGEILGTVGKPVIDTEVEIWDASGVPVADGEEGELVVRGPQVMQGYWNMPEETAKAISPSGFFKTGDIAIKQADGVLKIVDRLKDMIIVSGFNVYPNEVEGVLVQHPAVLEAAVVGAADAVSGERVHAYITVREPITSEDVIAFCKTQLTGYKVPKIITVLEELPKSSVGKVLRRELKAN
jgi:long-chain acyl-CoA synthetase